MDINPQLHAAQQVHPKPSANGIDKKQTGKANSLPEPGQTHSIEIAGYGRLQLDPNCALDYATKRTGQLSSLLMLLYGEGGETFRSYGHVHQDYVMWLASDLAEEVEQLIPIVHKEAYALGLKASTEGK